MAIWSVSLLIKRTTDSGWPIAACAAVFMVMVPLRLILSDGLSETEPAFVTCTQPVMVMEYTPAPYAVDPLSAGARPVTAGLLRRGHPILPGVQLAIFLVRDDWPTSLPQLPNSPRPLVDPTNACQLVLIYDFADMHPEVGQDAALSRLGQPDTNTDRAYERLDRRLLGAQACQYVQPLPDLYLALI